MNKWKALAILFTLFSIGVLRETFRICTSNASDIVSNRRQLIIMSVILSAVIIFLTIFFWRKSAKEKKLF